MLVARKKCTDLTQGCFKLVLEMDLQRRLARSEGGRAIGTALANISLHLLVAEFCR